MRIRLGPVYERLLIACSDDIVDLGDLVTTGVRSLWRKVKTASSERRGSNSSVGSSNSLASSASTPSSQYRKNPAPSPGPKMQVLHPVKEEHTPIHSAAPSAVSSPTMLPVESPLESHGPLTSPPLRAEADPGDQPEDEHGERESPAGISSEAHPVLGSDATEQNTSTRFGNPPYRFGLRRTPSDSKYGVGTSSRSRNESAVLGFNADSHRQSTDLLQNMVRDVRI